MSYCLPSCSPPSCRFKCGFFFPLDCRLGTDFLKNVVYNRKQAVLPPPRLQKMNGFRGSFTSTMKVKSSGGEAVADVDKNEKNGNHLDSEIQCSEEIPSSGSKKIALLIEDIKLLERFRSEHNWVQVLDVSRTADHPLAGARLLLLDSSGNIQSRYDPYQILTDAYYDVLASLPPILPPGPIAIYGLGGGTVAHLLRHFWPGIQIHGWELDPAVITVARKYFGLSELEEDSIDRGDGSISGVECDDPFTHSSSNTSSDNYLSGAPFREVVKEERPGDFIHQKLSKLTVHIGDALAAESVVDGGFAGILVDLFSEGAILPCLLETETWERIKERLMPGGRLMVNCGGSRVDSKGQKYGGSATECIATLARVFPGELFKRFHRSLGENCIALTGPPPDFRAWMRSLPEPLVGGVSDWRTAG